MNSRLLRSILFGIGLLMCFSPQVKASHAMGADLSYVCLGGNTYKFYATFYRDCAGISAPTTETLNITNGCGFFVPSATLTRDTLFNGVDSIWSGIEVSPLCPSALPFSTCNGGPLPGSEVYVYSAVVTLPGECSSWKASFAVTARNNAIDNLFDPDSWDLYVETNFDNTDSICNNSVLFTNQPVTYTCTMQPFFFNHGAFDPDGDSLVYELIQPLDDAFLSIPYVFPYAVDYPVTTVSGTFGFDTESGQIEFTPDVEQTCVVAVRVHEYRDGVEISNTIRDIQIIIENCSATPPLTTGITTTGGGAVALDDNSIEACPGDTIIFAVDFYTPDTSLNIDLVSNVSAAIPGATITFSGDNPATAVITWYSTPLDTGFFGFNITATDDGCPISGSASYSFDIDVLGGTQASPNVEYCVSGDPVMLTVKGGSMFSWTPSTGLDVSTGDTVFASPAVTTTYYVTSDFTGNCSNLDSVTVFVDNTLDLDVGEDPFICKYQSIDLNAVPTGVPPAGGFVWTWDPPTGLSDPSIQDPNADPASTTTYIVSTLTEAGCDLIDTVTVMVDDQESDAGDNTLVCPGGSTTLFASGGASYEWWAPDNLSCADCDNPTATVLFPEIFTVAITKPNGCIDTHTVIVDAYPLLLTEALNDTSIFIGEFAPIYANNLFASMVWTPGPLIGPAHLVSPMETTTYFLTATDSNGCVVFDTVTVIVNNFDEVFIPTAFSPNGDGTNDVLSIIDRGVASLNYFEIYNRWGELVFRTEDIDQGWDGRWKDELQNMGTYIYSISAKDTQGRNKIQNGEIQLVR